MSGQTPQDQGGVKGFGTFLVVWATQSLSVLGSALTLFATTIWAAQVLYPDPGQKQALALTLTALTLAFTVPTLLVTPVAGAWADRHDRRQIMMTMDFASCLVQLVLMTVLATGTVQVWSLCLLVAVQATFGAFHSSAFDASFVMMVPEEHLPRANAMMQTMWSLTGILAPGLAAFLFAVPAMARGTGAGGLIGLIGSLSNGTPLSIGLDAVTFFVGAAALFFVHIPSPLGLMAAGDEKGPGLLADVKTGVQFILARRPLLWLLGIFTVANFVVAPEQVLQPLLVKFNLMGDAAARGLSFEAAFAVLGTLGSVGGVAGGILVSVWGGGKIRRVLGVLIPVAIMGVALIGFGLSPSLIVAVAMNFVISAMVPAMNAFSQAIWQGQTPPELQGRVFAVRRVIAIVAGPISTAVAGWLGGAFNPGYVMAVLGVILTVFVLPQFLNRPLMQAEQTGLPAGADAQNVAGA